MVIEKMPERIKPSFHRYIGIDYSGAETPDSSLKGLRVYEASCDSLPVEIEPPTSPCKYWTRRGLTGWLAEHLSEDLPTIVGIDHGFSFPLRYFEVHCLEPGWPAFLDDFQKHWPTDAEYTYVDFIRAGFGVRHDFRTFYSVIAIENIRKSNLIPLISCAMRWSHPSRR